MLLRDTEITSKHDSTYHGSYWAPDSCLLHQYATAPVCYNVNSSCTNPRRNPIISEPPNLESP